MKVSHLIRSIYLYVATLIGLVMVIVSLYNFIDVGLRMTVFKQAQDPWITPSAVEPSTTTLDKNGNPITTTVQTAEERAARKTEIAAENTQRLVADRQRRLSTNIAVFIVGLPVFLYHWRLARNEHRDT